MIIKAPTRRLPLMILVAAGAAVLSVAPATAEPSKTAAPKPSQTKSGELPADAQMGWRNREAGKLAGADAGVHAAAPTGVLGLDVSSYQGKENWPRWVTRGKSFVYVKATQGTSYRNPYFSSQYTESYYAGMVHGAYHYANPAGSGDVTIATSLDRVGRSMTTCSARVEQDGKLIAIALAAFSAPREGIEFCDLVMPQVPGPQHYAARPIPPESPAIAHRWETRWAIGHPPVPGAPRGARAVAGGWIRLPEGREVDAAVAAALTDAWIPPTFSRVEEPVFVPTVDLTIHFRDEPPPAYDWCFVRFVSRHGSGGFIEEDGEIWSRDGRLLAQSRQLALAVPM